MKYILLLIGYNEQHVVLSIFAYLTGSHFGLCSFFFIRARKNIDVFVKRSMRLQNNLIGTFIEVVWHSQFSFNYNCGQLINISILWGVEIDRMHMKCNKFTHVTRWRLNLIYKKHFRAFVFLHAFTSNVMAFFEMFLTFRFGVRFGEFSSNKMH